MDSEREENRQHGQECRSEELLGVHGRELGSSLVLQTTAVGTQANGSAAHFLITTNVLVWIHVEVKVIQLCLTLCDLMNCTDHGILQVRILEWVAFSFSRGSSQHRDQTQVSRLAGGFFTSYLDPGRQQT